MSNVGHNSVPKDVLSGFVDRLTTLAEEQKALADDVADVKKEVKAKGLNPKAVAVLVKRKMEDADQKRKREELENDVDVYLNAFGLLG